MIKSFTTSARGESSKGRRRVQYSARIFKNSKHTYPDRCVLKKKHTYPGLVCFEFLKILAEYCILRLPIELSPLADVVQDVIIED